MFTPHTNRPNNNPIVIPSGSDSDAYSDSELSDMEVDPPSRPHRPGMSRFDAAPPSSMRYRASQPPYHTSLEQEKKVRSRLREERHAALSVLTDRELLTTQALAAQETLPQTRRRFLSKLMAPEDPAVATSLRADRFIIQHPTAAGHHSSSGVGRAGEGGPSSLTSPRPGSSTTVPMIVQRGIVDVHDEDDAGWRRPTMEGGREGGAGTGTGSVRKTGLND
ncbi:hypothetical protein P170DRAFT_465413 [Aspergillus steynii IBT 23096]|uniref:Uncharacterized protein n=1 Tax=Aspergillus steynii IBT 23096 TaxID=1392250 RepID=A0A2I2G4T6_9EURO|nr:uncharacterized protein P170DRAFT_465413 [Aspergillus steynii IBT 23096]PLB47888.1 hypothetical protein P170DRAFT_465413 [Aspergillus steynii IBT 23096]